MQEIKEYHITANGYDMSTGKYTIPECYVTATGYIEAAEILGKYLATGANADQVRLVTPAEPVKTEQKPRGLSRINAILARLGFAKHLNKWHVWRKGSTMASIGGPDTSNLNIQFWDLSALTEAPEIERVKLTKAALSKFIVWSTSRYNNYLGFGTKADAVQKAYEALLNKSEGTIDFECAGGVGEGNSRNNTGGRFWATKQSGAHYEIDCKYKVITELNSGRRLYFTVPEPYNSELNEQQQHYIKHAAGVSYGNSSGIKYLKKNKQPYRGYWAENSTNTDELAKLRELVKLGYMAEGTGPVADTYTYFHLTPKGTAEAAALVGIKI